MDGVHRQAWPAVLGHTWSSEWEATGHRDLTKPSFSCLLHRVQTLHHKTRQSTEVIVDHVEICWRKLQHGRDHVVEILVDATSQSISCPHLGRNNLGGKRQTFRIHGPTHRGLKGTRSEERHHLVEGRSTVLSEVHLVDGTEAMTVLKLIKHLSDFYVSSGLDSTQRCGSRSSLFLKR